MTRLLPALSLESKIRTRCSVSMLSPMLAKAVVLAFASLLASAAAGGSECSEWSPSPYEKHDNHSLSGPGNAIREARCLYGQEAANGECKEAENHDNEPASQECVCMSKEAARDAAEAHKALLMGGGGGLLGAGLLVELACLEFAGPIEEFAWRERQPAVQAQVAELPRMERFWNMAFWPIGLRDERVERVHAPSECHGSSAPWRPPGLM